ncbi:hypothetical protein C7R57_03360 [Macrococcoides caseolyticum subsp. caseolyticum]|uniref:hypothetical protein n=1 Tax=Macrococcoides caseolyticum TaxID=69966 RepID=UPI000CCFEFDB|nr:hypothetical protein [Macrococcus caseolyticus]PNZ72063.1 hypothetical protein CD152_08205 [Macrococcus caseolyticus]QPT47678.1 hypothetical protein I6G25_05355 [Macrococcus caseolyticus]RAK47572.1 hypothetical protein C7R57_03360 [Macrococcus caseolyticus subsp. caseolyticus]HCD19407.1 hypothetical protein [Macrococcus caseolyticus]
MSENQATQKILKAFKEDESIISVERKNNSVVVTYQLKEELQQPKDDTPTYTVKLDGSEVYEAVKKAADEVKRDLEKKERKLIRKIQYDALEKWLDERRGIIAYDKNNPKKGILINDNGIFFCKESGDRERIC